MRTVKIVAQDNTVLQPQYVQIADQDNIVANRIIVNVLIAPRVIFRRELVIHIVQHVVQVNIKILMHMHAHGAEMMIPTPPHMGPYQAEQQMQNVLIVVLDNKNARIRELYASIVFQANIVWQVQTMNVSIVERENLQQTMEEVLLAVIVPLAKKKRVILHVRYVRVVYTVRKHSTIDVLIVMQVNLVNLFIGHLVSMQNLLLKMSVLLPQTDL